MDVDNEQKESERKKEEYFYNQRMNVTEDDKLSGVASSSDQRLEEQTSTGLENKAKLKRID